MTKDTATLALPPNGATIDNEQTQSPQKKTLNFLLQILSSQQFGSKVTGKSLYGVSWIED